MAEYYAQRASAGLIIAEASQISPIGTVILALPGIYSDEQIEGWKKLLKLFMKRWTYFFTNMAQEEPYSSLIGGATLLLHLLLRLMVFILMKDFKISNTKSFRNILKLERL